MNPALPQPEFLPMTRTEMDRLGWDKLDVLLVTGDAYVDHPAFGAALLGRWLVANGFRTGIAAQPRWDRPDDVLRMGAPRLFAGVTAGALDSMLAHYTAFRKKRHDDAYTPGGRAGARPNRATMVYTGLVRHAFPGLPVLIGGIEASMRRITHYDFWSDRLRRSILFDSKADLLVYGMAEKAVAEAAQRLRDASEQPQPPAPRRRALEGIAGAAWIAAPPHPALPDTAEQLPSHEDIARDPKLLVAAALAVERQVHEGRWATQQTEGRLLVLAPPAPALTESEMDALYALPFQRRAHPSYREPVPAVDMVQFSITTHRGCAGGCSFCALAAHQGRRIQSRSRRSVVQEARCLTTDRDWRGSITDVGGPTANMWGASCRVDGRGCRRASCLVPDLCPHFRHRQGELARLLAATAAVPGVRHVRVASGIRHDLALADPAYATELVRHYVGGQVKLAPEHCSERVLQRMRKPSFSTFERFLEMFVRVSGGCGKEQYVIPYLISAFPGCTDDDMRELADWLRRKHWKPQQVQCFVPTPGTVASAMFHAGIDPDGLPIFVARTDAERLRQHRLLTGATDPAQAPARAGRWRSTGERRRR